MIMVIVFTQLPKIAMAIFGLGLILEPLNMMEKLLEVMTRKMD